MKMNKKKLAVVSLILCVMAVISMGSLAWFTAEDSVINNLKFVNDFAMDLYETGDDGQIIGAEGDTVGMQITDAIPGKTIHKDPTVVNKSSTEPQWIRMTVKVSKGDKWLGYLGENASLAYLFRGYDDSLWAHPEDPYLDEDNNMVAVFYLKEKLAPAATATLFTDIHIYEGITVALSQTLDETNITIEAKAIQSSGIDAESCVDAFAVVEGKKN